MKKSINEFILIIKANAKYYREQIHIFFNRIKNCRNEVKSFKEYVRDKNLINESLIRFIYINLMTGADTEDYFEKTLGSKTPFTVHLNFVNQVRLNIVKDTFNQIKHRSLLDNKYSFSKNFNNLTKRKFFLYDSKQNLSAVFEKNNKCVLKPTSLYGGKGIRFFDLKDQPISEIQEELKPYEKKGYILEECVKQDGLLSSFHPQSVNTIRVITYLSKDEFKVLDVFLRTGISGAKVDNVSSGGVFWCVDLKTGEILYGIHHYQKITHHPTTGIKVAGNFIPHYSDVIDYCKAAHSQVPQLPVIGWDVLVSGNEISMIEANSGPGYRTQEKEIWKFLKKKIKDKKISDYILKKKFKLKTIDEYYPSI